MPENQPEKPTNSQAVRVRFAPSPTGFVHIGSLRTALFTFLFARRNQGRNILRIEDTDQNRIVEGSLENLLKVMKMVGINYDEGFYLDDKDAVQQKGDHGPYVQSQRLEFYRKYSLQLVEQGYAYYCFCDEQRLEELRTEQVALKKPPMYDRLCRRLTKEQTEEKLRSFQNQGKTPVIRQAIPEQGQTIIHDLIYGDIIYDHHVLDDQVLMKSDGFPTYHLAVVVDDHLMEITHVIRGEEWIPSTPKHLLLYQAFNWPVPLFAHLPLILNPDKTKLSKRQGDVAVEDVLAKGYLVEALTNFVAFLGWNPKTEQEIFSMDELIAQFDLAKVNKAGAVFDINKLDWLNGLYIRQKSLGELVGLLLPFWMQSGYILEQGGTIVLPNLKTTISRDYLQNIAALERERLKKLSEIGERTRYFFAAPDYDGQLLVWKKADAADAKAKLHRLKELISGLLETELTKENLETKFKVFITENSFDNGSVLWPLRVALTGLAASPGPFEVASVLAQGLGKQELVTRVESAIVKLQVL